MSVKNFIIDTRYPMEKVAYLLEASGTTSSAGSPTIGAQTTLTLSNPTNTAMLLDGIYSFDNWQTAFPISAGDPNRYWQFVQLYCTREQIRVSFTGYSTSIPFKVRLWGFLPEDNLEADVPNTASLSSYPYTIDTSKDYMSIFDSGRVSASTSSPVTIVHNLGYIPLMKLWRGSNTNWQLVPITSNEVAELSTIDAKIYGTSSSTANYYYRIYTNEA